MPNSRLWNFDSESRGRRSPRLERHSTEGAVRRGISLALRAASAPALALVAGFMHAWAVASPTEGQPLWWLQPAAVALLVILLDRCRSAIAAAGLCWLFAACSIGGSVWWLYISLHVYGGLSSALAALSVLSFSGFLATYYALAGAVFCLLRPRDSTLRACLFAVLWLAADLLRATILTGFPWGVGGYAHTDGPFSTLAPWVGVYGIGAAAAFGAALLAGMLVRPRQIRGAWRPLVILGLVLAVAGRPHEAQDLVQAPAVSVTLLQANIAQEQKFESATGVRDALEWYAAQLLTTSTELVVAPETAIPLLPDQLPAGYAEKLRSRFATGQQAALIGMPLGSEQQGYTNSVVGLRPEAPAYRYNKHHLVPFGEFVPPLFRWFTRMMNIPLGDFETGAVGQPSFDWKGNRFAPNICYEDLFGEELAVRFRDAAQAPTVLVNVSNIAWFGNTVAIDQHLQISRMRAREFERPVLRATNTGATAVIDCFGRVTDLLPRHTRGVLVARVQGGERITPYAWWLSRLGLWPFCVLVAMVLAVAAKATRDAGK